MDYVLVIVVGVVEHTAFGLLPSCSQHSYSLCFGVQYLLNHLFVLRYFVCIVVMFYLTLQGKVRIPSPLFIGVKKPKL